MRKKIWFSGLALTVAILIGYLLYSIVSSDYFLSILPGWHTTLPSEELIMVLILLAVLLIVLLSIAISFFIFKGILKLRNGSIIK